jgi:hypothetical protein
MSQIIFCIKRSGWMILYGGRLVAGKWKKINVYDHLIVTLQAWDN